MEIMESSGNVFRDIGFSAEEAERLRVRAELMVALRRLIQDRGLTQAAAAKWLRVSQPRISNLVRSRIDIFSIDMLVNMLARAGMQVNVAVSPLPASEKRKRPSVGAKTTRSAGRAGARP